MAIAADLKALKFNTDVYKTHEEWVLLVGLNNEEMLLQAAEKENQLAVFTSTDPAKREKRNQKK